MIDIPKRCHTHIVGFDRRSHNPILREALLERDSLPIPWLGQRKIEFTYR